MQFLTLRGDIVVDILEVTHPDAMTSMGRKVRTAVVYRENTGSTYLNLEHYGEPILTDVPENKIFEAFCRCFTLKIALSKLKK